LKDNSKVTGTRSNIKKNKKQLNKSSANSNKYFSGSIFLLSCEAKVDVCHKAPVNLQEV